MFHGVIQKIKLAQFFLRHGVFRVDKMHKKRVHLISTKPCFGKLYTIKLAVDQHTKRLLS